MCNLTIQDLDEVYKTLEPKLLSASTDLCERFIANPRWETYQAVRKSIYQEAKKHYIGYSSERRRLTSALVTRYLTNQYDIDVCELYKKVDVDWVTQDHKVYIAYMHNTDQRTPYISTTQTKETIMKPINAHTKAIETRTYIYGRPASEVSDMDIINHIRDLETELKSLKEVEHKPAALIHRIDEIGTEIMDLVNFSNSRSEKAA